MRKLTTALTLLSVFILTSCASTSNTSLFADLGGTQGIESITDSFIQEIGRDKQIFHYFADANVTRFREQFITHICSVSGGPCQYQGDSMVDIHTGMNIPEADFNRVVELLIIALKSNEIPFPIQNKLLAKLAPLRPQIIHR